MPEGCPTGHRGGRPKDYSRDRHGVMQILSSTELVRSRYGPLIEEIKELMASQDEFCVVWVRRTANRGMYNLARDDYLSKFCKDLVLCSSSLYSRLRPLTFNKKKKNIFDKKRKYYSLRFIM